LNERNKRSDNAIEEEGVSTSLLEEKIAEGCAIISIISKLKYEMARDKEMLYVISDGQMNL
jgi:hypothetical protein